MRSSRLRLRVFSVLFSLAFLIPAPHARAQYMYLDSNGDGVHTSADEVHSVGPTVIDIWFDIGHNRDGSVATCKASAAEPLNMFSYVVDLTASGGTVNYSGYTNRILEMGALGSPLPPTGANFSTGPFYMAGSSVLPPGKYLLGTLTVYVASGTPSIQIVPGRDFSTFRDMTAFGSQCDGTDFPNTIALGTDWSDIDGLPFGTGGTENQSPTLVQPTDMLVNSGETATQTISAEDPEGQPLTLSKGAGPAFMFVTTLDPGAGTAHGEVRLAPFLSDVGSNTGDVAVTDGAASDHASFGITVSQGLNHPPYTPPVSGLTITAGQVSNFLLVASDPDGGTVHFARVSGPDYFSLRELASRPGGASALFALRPTLCDMGSATATFSVSDGVNDQPRKVDLTVVPASPDSSVHHFSAGFLNGIAVGDLNADGNLDVVAAHEDLPNISVYLGNGGGDLAAPVIYPVSGQDGGVAIADFNQDGRLDVAVTNPGGAGVDVLLSSREGTLLPAVTYPTGTGPSKAAAADFNRDGFLDLATNNQEAGTVTVLLGAGDGTFGPKHDSHAGSRPRALALGDFNLDGRPDVAVADPVPGSTAGVLTVLPGLGDGTFGSGIETGVTGYPFSLVSGDWNWDGIADVAFTDISRSGTVQTCSGRGDGTFAPGVVVATAAPLAFLFVMVDGDLDGDGNLDLVVSDVSFTRLMVFRGNGSGAFASPTFIVNRFAQGLAIGDMNADGRPDLVGSGSLLLDVSMNTFPAPTAVGARAFVLGGNRGQTGNSDLCVRIELDKGKDKTDLVDAGTVILRSEGTGSVSEIHSNADLCFSSQDVGALFDKIATRSRLTPQLSGAAVDGRPFCTTIALNVGGKSAASQPSFAPNPLNPVSMLSFSTVREGPAKALIFDIQGRLVRKLVDTPRLAAGEHEYLFDGTGDRGSPLPSSVYFYQVETTKGQFAGRIVILK